ncbi:DUF1385 domain-containing protein [Candidatus Woesearchaeota archaeon]|nr:DUF1385 domain-containing protein [Candidatus Woesearchaeota archaeon]
MAKKSQKCSPKCSVGGQAVIEGVLMKNDAKVAIAVRRPDGKISLKKETWPPLSKKHKWLGWPFVRGVVNLYEMTVMGIKALNYSANESLGEEEEKISQTSLIVTTVIALVVALALFKLLPLGITKLLFGFTSMNGTLAFNLVDGLLRIVLFLLYVIARSLMSDVRRLFQYHGAEHMVVNAYEAGKKLTPANVRRYTTLHPRCGTSFLFIVLITAILVFSVVKIDLPLWLLFFYRLPLLLPIAGISYEVLKLTARFRNNWFMKAVTLPGMGVQKLTTRRPTKRQIEVAIAAFKAVVKG